MNQFAFTFVLAACLSAGAVRANTENVPVVQPSPAPTIASNQAPSAPPIVQVPNGTVKTNGSMQIVYMPQLPSAAEVTNAAAAQGLTVERIVQTSTQVIAYYRDANGQTSSVAYQSLPPASNGSAASAPATTTTSAPTVVVTSPPQTVVTAPQPTVVYQTAPRVYYDYPPYYYPPVWYPPVSLSFGFGYGYGYGYRHGYPHHHGGHRHW
jgi:hypothetical protein